MIVKGRTGRADLPIVSSTPPVQTDNAPACAPGGGGTSGAPQRRNLRAGWWDPALAPATVAALAAALGVGVALWLDGSRQAAYARERDQTDAARVAAVVAGGLRSCCEASSADAETALARLAQHDSIASLEWLDASGRPRATWPTAVRGSAAAGPPPVVAEAGVRDENGRPAGVLRAALRSSAPGGRMDLRLGVPALGTALAVFVLVWVGNRRTLRGARAIEHSLRDYARGTEKELLALAISDSLGEAARGWNQILSETVALRQELQVRSEIEKTAAILGRFDSGIYRRMLDQLPIGVVRIDASQKVRYVNPAGRAFIGPTRDPIEGAEASTIFDDEPLRCALSGVATGVHTGQTVDRTIKEGERETSLRYHVLPSSDGPQAEAVVLIEDLGQMRELERGRDQFLYHVTHELRTPLTNIRAYVETLTRPDFDEEQTRKECYNVIVSETARLTRLIEDVLSVSQLEVGTLRLELVDLDVSRLLRQIVQDNLGAADEKGVALTLKLPPKLPRVRADKQRLAVLATNVVGNAVKYTPSGGRVDVSVAVEDGSLRIAVTDTGIGIAPADQARVFEKFYRAPNGAAQAVAGTGLGLAIAREIARMHGGDIRVTSQVGKGSTFTISLPLPAEVAK